MMRRAHCAAYVLCLLIACAASEVCADVHVPATFADNMLLQRGKPIPVYGMAEPAEKVTVEFADQRKQATADAAGKWRVVLDPLGASAAAQEMRIVGRNTVVIRNVLVGDLWLASGQSNMQMAVREVNNAAAEMEAANYAGIRFFMVPRDLASSPRSEPAGKWLVCTPENVGSFSAAAYFFAKELHTRYDVPIGIINSAVGSSTCESWIPAEVLEANKSLPQPPTIPAAEYTDWKTYDAVRQKVYDEAAHKDPGIRKECLAWAKPDYDASGWKDVAVPGSLESRGMNIDGAVWFRCEVELPKAWEGKDASLYLGTIEQNSVAYVNGTEVGRTENHRRTWVFRTPRVPGSLVRAGRNVVAVRIFNELGPGGFYPNYPRPLDIARGNEQVLLPKTWKCKAELSLKPAKLARNLPYGYQLPTAIFNAMIAPYTSTPVRGFLWYQGESNAGRFTQHDTLFPALIQSWRHLWKDDTLPFYFVQLASYRARDKQPSDGGWAFMRESQAKALAVVPHTGMAVTIDIGDATNVHPKNKQDVGKRLAYWACRDCYGDAAIAVSGPLYASSRIEGNRIRIRFTHADDGLRAKGGELKGFAIAGADKKFAWADATIDGDTVVVRSDTIKRPLYVRYAWADNPECTLVNGAGLPAGPFRTDP